MDKQTLVILIRDLITISNYELEQCLLPKLRQLKNRKRSEGFEKNRRFYVNNFKLNNNIENVEEFLKYSKEIENDLYKMEAVEFTKNKN